MTVTGRGRHASSGGGHWKILLATTLHNVPHSLDVVKVTVDVIKRPPYMKV